MTLLQFLKTLQRSSAQRKQLIGRVRNIARVRSRIAGCTHGRYKNSKRYFHRGIQIHMPWLFDPMDFVEYIERLPGAMEPWLTLDRIDNDGHYEPGNLRICTQAENCANRTDGAVTPLYNGTPELYRAARRFRRGWDSVRALQPQPTQLGFEPEWNPPDNYELLYLALRKLNQRERYVVECRFWYDMTLAEVGQTLHLTRERTRQLEQRAVSKLRHFV